VAIQQHGSEQWIFGVAGGDLRLVGVAEPIEEAADDRPRIRSPLQAPQVKRCAVPDPDGVGQAGRVLRSGGLHRFVERIAQEILAGFRFDGDEAIPVDGLQHGLELLGVEPLGGFDDRFGVGGDHVRPPGSRHCSEAQSTSIR